MYGFKLGDRVATRTSVIDREPSARTRTGRVIGFGVSDTGDSYVIVALPNPDDDTAIYQPERLVRVYIDEAGVPRLIDDRQELRAAG